MPRLIIINGKPAVGKSTFLRVLRAQLSIPALGKDDIKEFIFNMNDRSNSEWSAIVGVVSVEMLYTYTEQFLAAGKDAIIENAFWADRAGKVLTEICRKTHSESLELYLYADIATRDKRNRSRIADGSRHAGHADQNLVLNNSLDDERYRPLAIGRMIKIDTSQIDEGSYKDYVRIAADFLKEGETTHASSN